ncbi:MAG TPA: hypothetical protein VGQ69_14080 [Gemmatimonadales bacterium]|jgi:hypothetical protein|nr:hypothetical protein [Gemmatimonadales bacterium]
MPTRRLLIAGAALLTTVAFAQGLSSAGASHSKPAELRSAMRKLWEDHITWTRLYIVSAAANLPEKDATTQRLLQNQSDIGNAIKPYYGDAAGGKLTALLKDHITIATELIAAAQQGDNTKKEDAAKRWNQNADEIAAFLSGANPKHWPLADMKGMMHQHLDLTTAEVVAHLQKDWSGSVAAYDKVHEQILRMADQLAAGIQAQFPAKAAE